MMDFITDLREKIAAKKAEHEENKESLMEKRQDNKTEFKDGLEGLSKAERIAEIRSRVADLMKKLTGGDSEDEDMDDEESDESDEDEVEDESSEDDDSDDDESESEEGDEDEDSVEEES